MRLTRSHNLTLLKTDPSTGLGIKFICKLTKSLIETSNKVYEPKTYDKAINNLIHGNRRYEVIDKELWNLDSYQTWCYKKLPSGKKMIGYKWVFKVKYKSNKTIKRYKTRLVAQRFSQIPKVDFTEIFILIIRQESLRIFFIFTTLFGLILT